MSDSNEQKEARLSMLARNAVKTLLAIHADLYGDVLSSECTRIAVEIGNLLAPQIYGNRAHGISNAISNCVRCCSEALFWLDMADAILPPTEAKKAVNALMLYLSSPVLSTTK